MLTGKDTRRKMAKVARWISQRSSVTNCDEMGHFATECKKAKSGIEARHLSHLARTGWTPQNLKMRK